MRDVRVLAPVVVAALSLGCMADQPALLVDTSGAEFGWDCKHGSCTLTVLAETPEPQPCPEDTTSGYSYVWDRFIEIDSICAEPGSWSSTPGDGRYLACEVDDDCPQLDFHESGGRYECSDGLCQNIDVERHPRDELRRGLALPLCIAEVPRDESWMMLDQAETLLDAHCGSDPRDLCPLPLPPSCWQLETGA